ncbi:ABC transporter permease [Cohnella suwonensis]|uniref:ABC transporter permease n=1 Tax=Cohnella suwonensis TaxID=696072 RepID=A0ABW0LU45_9BACL
MSSLTQLIRNENMKIYRRPRTWIMVGILVLAIGLLSWIMKWDSSKDDQSNWQNSLTQQNAQMQMDLTQLKDTNDNQREWLTEQIKLNQYYLDHDINPNDLSLWNYVNNSAELIILITILTVIIAADMIAAEFSWGTIKLLLVGPSSRTKIMLAKYVSTMIFAILLLVLSFAVAFLFGSILEGFSGLSLPHLTIGDNGLVHEGSMIVNSLQQYGYNIVSLLLYVTMAFMISAAFRSSSMAIAFSLLFMLVGNTLSEILREYSWVKYLLFSNIDLRQYLEGGQPLHPDMTLGFSIGMLAIYYIVFKFVAWALFTKRDVAA